MPSFDIVSEVEMPEVTNATDQANREVGNRYDFKGSDARFELKESTVTMFAANSSQLKSMLEILRLKLGKRNVDQTCLQVEDSQTSGKGVRQEIIIRQGIDKELAKKMVKMVKDKKMKVQASIQENKVRITGKNRDDLQAVMAMFKEANLGLPLQYENFRD